MTKIVGNAFTGHIFDPRPYVADKAPKNPQRGKAIDLNPRRSGIVITPPGYASSKRILRKGAV
ncbi:hypothetical protein [Pseudorhodoferax sp. Leaf274]|uniref:hypothetical protein n=1 Tax=Pseudorhodoferax sp. Leaf274 TaxID=1736318 RepID=UPI0007025CD7|nr:hypothetical protein [Pseudorhodoferax sp. Leaf274]KQP36117.1 hypothetical protein ASF44_16235 [Pseudorhodoferax sp. Leaf274]